MPLATAPGLRHLLGGVPWEVVVRIAAGGLFVVMGLLLAGQLLSIIDFEKAQRLGLQEKPEEVDPLVGRLEWGTALWGVLSLGTLPVAGILMLADHSWWPLAALIGGGVYFDTGGREAVKILALHRHGVRVGGPTQLRTFLVTYAVLTAVGCLAVVVGVAELA